MEELAAALYKVLSNAYVLQVKTQSVHWNTVGPDFYQTHLQLERVYNSVNEDIDRIAENIRALDARVPATLAGFIEGASISDFTSIMDVISSIKELVSDIKVAQEDMVAANAIASSTSCLGVLNMLGDLHESYSSHYFLLSSTIKN